jgi:TonB family protein
MSIESDSATINGDLFQQRKRWRWIAMAGTAVFCIANVLFATKPAAAQGAQGQPLSLAQVEKLIQVQAPDAAIAAEIRRRGLSFAPSKETSAVLRRAGAGSETLQAIDELRPMLDEAKQAIPAILTKIYNSLDQGNPQAIRPFVSPQIAGDMAKLDAVCRPFTYRAHYVEAIIERPGQRFEVRVHAFFQPFEERASVLAFRPVQGSFQLTGIDGPTDDWFGPGKEAAIRLARNFIYAAKAQQASVLAGLVASRLDVSQYTANTCWREALQLVMEVKDAHAELEERKGLKIRVRAYVTVKTSSALDTEQANFWVDRLNDQYKIVVAEPLHNPSFILRPPILFNNAPPVCRGMDEGFFAPLEGSDLEDDTLKRFGLSSSLTELEQVYHVGGDVMAPVVTSKAMPSCTDAARKIRAKGKVGLSFVVDAYGYVKDIKVVKTLEPSLDENAVQAARTWTFQPATRHGTPVAVRAAVEDEFSCY